MQQVSNIDVFSLGEKDRSSPLWPSRLCLTLYLRETRNCDNDTGIRMLWLSQDVL